MRSIPNLPNGAPSWRLRYLSQHLHDFGPRALEDFFKRLLARETVDALAVVELLEWHTDHDPAIVKAVGGYELESPLRDLTWVIEMDRRQGRVPPPHHREQRAKLPPLRLVPASLKPTQRAP